MRTQSKSKGRDRSIFSGFLIDRKISTKIGIGFSMILVIMLVISGVAYFEFGTVSRDFSDFSRAVHNNGLVSEIDRQFLALQRYVGDSSADLSQDVAGASKSRALVRKQINEALTSVKDPERLKIIKDLSDRFEIYSKEFDRVTPMRLDQQKLAKEVLDPAGQKLLADLQQLQVDAASTGGNSASILFGEAIKIGMQLRLNVEKVTGRHDAAVIEATKRDFTNLNLIFAQIKKTPADANLSKNVDLAKASAKAYNDAFLKFASQSATIEQLLLGDMGKVAREIGADVEAIKANSLAYEQQTQREMSSLISWAITIILALAIGGFVIGIVFARLIGRVISKPVVALVPELKKLADGDFNVSLLGLGRKDEIGEISAAVEMVVEKVGATIGNIKIAANEVTNASAEISTSTTDLSQRTEEQAASLEETSASMEEISATVKKNAENARQANEFATETNTVAEHGGTVASEAVTAMARIEESSRKISDIIGVIDEIARQTNLLALNAAVEAARAGEAGRGFAVVASEVRSLAQRSSQAAKDIKALITNSNSQVKDGVDLVNKAGESLNAIVASIKKVTAIVGEIANASIEQSTGIEQINKALTQMDEVTQQNSALVEENAATAKTLEHQAKSMDERVAIFRLRSGGYAERGAQFARRADIGERRLVGPQTAAAAPSRGPAAAERKRPPDAAPKRVAVRSNVGAPVGRMHMALAAAVDNDPDWKEF